MYITDLLDILEKTEAKTQKVDTSRYFYNKISKCVRDLIVFVVDNDIVTISDLKSQITKDYKANQSFIYIQELLRMNVLFNQGLEASKCFDMTIGKYENTIVRNIAKNLISEKIFEPVDIKTEKIIIYTIS